MAEVDINQIEGLTDGANALAGFMQVRTYIDQNELRAAAHILGANLEDLASSERFWNSATYAVRELPPAQSLIAAIGESEFETFEYKLLTGDSPQFYTGRLLSGAHAIDLISRVIPHSVATSAWLEVNEQTREGIRSLAFQVKENANAQPSAEPRAGEPIPGTEPSRFGSLIKALGRGVLAVAGAAIAGVNAYVAIATTGAAAPAFGSMGVGLLALGSAVYNDPGLMRKQPNGSDQPPHPDPQQRPSRIWRIKDKTGKITEYNLYDPNWVTLLSGKASTG